MTAAEARAWVRGHDDSDGSAAATPARTSRISGHYYLGPGRTTHGGHMQTTTAPRTATPAKHTCSRPVPKGHPLPREVSDCGGHDCDGY